MDHMLLLKILNFIMMGLILFGIYQLQGGNSIFKKKEGHFSKERQAAGQKTLAEMFGFVMTLYFMMNIFEIGMDSLEKRLTFNLIFGVIILGYMYYYNRKFLKEFKDYK